MIKAFLKKWFWTYRKWTWPPLAIVLILLVWLAYTVAQSGGWAFFYPLVLVLIGIGTYYAVFDEYPPIWFMSVAVCLPIFMWGFWLINPIWYQEWRSSGYFLWMVLTLGTLGFLATIKNDPVAKAARIGLWILLIAIVLMGAASKARSAYAAARERSATLVAKSDAVRSTREITREWSEVIKIPLGTQVIWEPERNVDFEIKTRSGRVYRFNRDPENDTRTACERHEWIGEATSSLQIRLVDKEIEKANFDLAFSDYTAGGKCAGQGKQAQEVPQPKLEKETGKKSPQPATDEDEI